MRTEAVVRGRRQITLPREACEQLGIRAGDRLEFEVEDGVLIAHPAKGRALDALREIRDAFSRSGVGERELQAEGRRLRRQLSAERYGEKT